MPHTFKLIQKDDPQIAYRTQRKTFLLGRGQNCEIVIGDPHISRVQAKVTADNGRYYIKNAGRNPLLVNGTPTAGRLLDDGDEIQLGKISFIFQAGEPQASAIAKVQTEDRTIVVSAPLEEAANCRLMITSPGGDTRAIPIDREKLVLGRSAEADVRLDDPLVSRRHCLVEKRPEGVFARNVSATNPLLINGQPTTESRLFSGDRLQCGSYAIVFSSNLPEDIGRLHQSVANPSRTPPRALRLLITVLLLGLSGYVGYTNAFKPWQVGRTLARTESQIAAGEQDAAHQTLQHLLDGELSADQVRRARELLAKSAMGIAEKKAGEGDLPGAKKYLSDHLAVYGSGQEAASLWDRLDYYCLGLAKKMEADGHNQEALQQFAAVRDSSLYQAEAQKGIRRIWLRTQHQQLEEQTIVDLLKQGEAHFAAKRFLTPVNQNAYAVYQAVLLLDPGHVMALNRINQIKAFYRSNAESRYRNEEWAAALSYYERYRIIDPEDKDAEARLTACRKHLAEAKTSGRGWIADSRNVPQNQDLQREEVQSLLEASGTESAWIMKYLFEEQNGEPEAETPW